MAALVELGSLVLAGGVTDTATKGWFFTDLGDWYTLSPSKSDVRERPQANGAFTIAQDWRQSLAYSIKGVFLGDTHADVQAAKRVLASACGTGKPVTVAVDGC